MMLSILLAALAINVAPIAGMHLETQEGKEQFAQKLKTKADVMAQKWEAIRQLQTEVQQKLALLEQAPKDSDEWKNLAAECEALSVQWKQQTEDFTGFQQFIQTAAVGIQDPQRVLSLVEKYQAGEAISDEDSAILENIAKVCE